MLLQAAEGSSRWVPVSREIRPGDVMIPVLGTPTGCITCSFEGIKGVTVQDIVEHKDAGNGGIFRHIRFTESKVQECVDILEKKYGINIDKHKERYLNIYNTLEVILPAGSKPDDLIEKVERSNEGTNETGIAIKDVRLRDLINNIACLISAIEPRIKYTWLYKRKPLLNSWGFRWYSTFFGSEKTTRLIERSEHIQPSLKNKRNRQKLLGYIRKEVKRESSGIGRKIDPALIDRYVQDKLERTRHDKRRVDSLIRQTDRHITRLYHERIKCDQYERIYCDEHDHNTRCEKCQKFHDKYEEYCKFARDVLTNPNNKSNALIVPLLKLVYPMELRKLHKLSN